MTKYTYTFENNVLTIKKDDGIIYFGFNNDEIQDTYNDEKGKEFEFTEQEIKEIENTKNYRNIVLEQITNSQDDLEFFVETIGGNPSTGFTDYLVARKIM
jgi:hypothetical protein